MGRAPQSLKERRLRTEPRAPSHCLAPPSRAAALRHGGVVGGGLLSAASPSGHPGHGQGSPASLFLADFPELSHRLLSASCLPRCEVSTALVGAPGRERGARGEGRTGQTFPQDKSTAANAGSASALRPPAGQRSLPLAPHFRLQPLFCTHKTLFIALPHPEWRGGQGVAMVGFCIAPHLP